MNDEFSDPNLANWNKNWNQYLLHQLRYDSYRSDGIFGTFQFHGDAEPFCVTLSHAYKTNELWYPIVVPGKTYACVRGPHCLADGVQFETFEIVGIDGHDGLLFHPLNFNSESSGCTGLGQRIAKYDSNRDGQVDEADDNMITHSRKTFAAWMTRLAGVDTFMLQVN